MAFPQRSIRTHRRVQGETPNFINYLHLHVYLSSISLGGREPPKVGNEITPIYLRMADILVELRNIGYQSDNKCCSKNVDMLLSTKKKDI